MRPSLKPYASGTRCRVRSEKGRAGGRPMVDWVGNSGLSLLSDTWMDKRGIFRFSISIRLVITLAGRKGNIHRKVRQSPTNRPPPPDLGKQGIEHGRRGKGHGESIAELIIGLEEACLKVHYAYLSHTNACLRVRIPSPAHDGWIYFHHDDLCLKDHRYHRKKVVT